MLRKQLKLIIILQMATSIVNIFVRIEWREAIEFLPRNLLIDKKNYINKEKESLLYSKLSEKRANYFFESDSY